MNNNLISNVKEYMQSDEREKLWDIVCDTEDNDLLMHIIDYFIDKRDSFYVCESLCFNDNSNLEDVIFSKILQTDDREFIYNVSINGPIQGIVKSKNLIELKNYLKKCVNE